MNEKRGGHHRKYKFVENNDFLAGKPAAKKKKKKGEKNPIPGQNIKGI